MVINKENLKEIIEDFEKEHLINDELDGVPRKLIDSNELDWQKFKNKLLSIK